MKCDQARIYINSIRNKSKKAYAEQYWFWLLHRAVYNTREEAPEPSNIGAMAAQAVRMNLRPFAEEAR